MRKVYVQVTMQLILEMDDGIEVSQVISEMETNITSKTAGADIMDVDLLTHEVTDSK